MRKFKPLGATTPGSLQTQNKYLHRLVFEVYLSEFPLQSQLLETHYATCTLRPWRTTGHQGETSIGNSTCSKNHHLRTGKQQKLW